MSSIGRGPNEYQTYIYARYGFDEYNNTLFTSDKGPYGKEWKCINVETNKIESIFKKPWPENDDDNFSAYAPWLLRDNLYVSFSNNRTGKEKTKLIVFNREGTIIRRFPNHLEYNWKNTGMPYNPGIFYYYNGLTYFKEWFYNDTVFLVNEHNVSPHIIFKLGNKQPSYAHQAEANFNKEKYLINFVYESDLFVLFNFRYFAEVGTMNFSGGTITQGKNISTHTGYYDKKSKQVYISSTSDFTKSGFEISGIPIGFHPIFINKNHEMIAQIDPEELMQNRDKMDSRHTYLFQKVREDDNPIVIIAKLKQ